MYPVECETVSVPIVLLFSSISLAAFMKIAYDLLLPISLQRPAIIASAAGAAFNLM
jgi:hypothetical protein